MPLSDLADALGFTYYWQTCEWKWITELLVCGDCEYFAACYSKGFTEPDFSPLVPQYELPIT